MSTQTKTVLTNNSQSIATLDNGSATIQFQDSTTGTILWTAKVNTSTPNYKLNTNTGTDTLTLVAGLTVTYQPVSSSQYYIYLNGQIIDSGNTTTFKNKKLGDYVRSDVSATIS